ncbi:uncharacterized protein EAF01_009364 [Botrytis porri]|uniref:Uncharacterized protein n=1 Tax=Botrytis porri TaxID=87229 RepID=A0A4Z1KT22_9HELO|nr:uncharacterized protein EAF01_009364 [Botrytis porri]KAF7896961.1 hypothetical protein EAF01_009364 [Botrytis porri]TGO86765.1 hypothetical protein BPOR_0278g00070 [Botrytis porri]
MAFGNHLRDGTRFNLEWDEYSLDIPKARVDSFPFDMKMEQRKKDCEKLKSALDIARHAGRGIEVASEKVKNMKSRIKRLESFIGDMNMRVRQYEERYDEVHNGERSIDGKMCRAVRNSSKTRI